MFVLPVVQKQPILWDRKVMEERLLKGSMRGVQDLGLTGLENPEFHVYFLADMSEAKAEAIMAALSNFRSRLSPGEKRICGRCSAVIAEDQTGMMVNTNRQIIDLCVGYDEEGKKVKRVNCLIS